MKRNDCFPIGRFTGTPGKNGEILLQLHRQFTGKIQEEQYIYTNINERDPILVPLFVLSLSSKSKSRIFLQLKFVDNEKDALHLINREVFLPVNKGGKNTSQLEEISLLEGFEVIDENHGDLGQLRSILEYPSQLILSIIDENEVEILVPLTEDTITEVDEINSHIKIQSPPGLVELYRGEEK